MPPVHARLLLLLALVAACGLRPLAASELSPDPLRVSQHAEALLAIGDRSPGSEGARQAAAYIEASLLAAGYPAVHRRQSLITVAQDDSQRPSQLRFSDRSIPLGLHLPNGQAASTTYGVEISGKLHLLGAGDGASLQGRDLTGGIVVLDGDSGAAWLKCAELGAAAIIFIHPERIDANDLADQWLLSSLAIPRFVADADAFPAAADGQTVQLWSGAQFQPHQVDTLVAEVPGTDPSAYRQSVLLTVGYESSGNIIGFSPGATKAWNCALLLTLAEQLVREPPARPVLIAFHAGRPEAFRGLRDLLGSLTDAAHNRTGDVNLQKDLGAIDLPLGNLEGVNLALVEWRAGQIENAFRAFLADPEPTEAKLNQLLENLQGSPETADAFAGLDYLAMPKTDDAAAAAPDEARLRTGNYVKIVLALLAAGFFLYLYRRHEGFSLPALVLCLVPSAWLLVVGLQPPARATGTNLDLERRQIRQIGLNFVAEEAARRADELAPQIENLRLFDSLLQKWDDTAYHEREATLARNRRWQLDHSSMITARELLAAVGVDVRPDEALEPPSMAYREHIASLAADTRSRGELWRNIQQKLGKKALEVDGEANRLQDLVRAVVGDGDDAEAPLARHRRHARRLIAAYRSGAELRAAVKRPDIGLSIAFDLTDGGPRWSTISQGQFLQWSTQRLHKELARIIDRLQARQLEHALAYTDGPYELGEDVGSWWPDNYAHDAMVAGWFSHAFSISTVNDGRLRSGTPMDNAGNFVADRFLAQTYGLSAFLRTVIDNDSLIDSSFPYRPQFRTGRIAVETRSEGSIDGKKGYPFPMVTMYLGEYAKLGNDFKGFARDVRYFEHHWGDAFGVVRIPWIPTGIQKMRHKTFGVIATGFDARGRIVDKIASDGVYKTKGVDNSGFTLKSIRALLLNVFACESSTLYGTYDPRLLKDLSSINVLSAARDAKPDYFHVEADRGTVSIFSPPGVRLRVLAAEGEIGNRLLLLGDHLLGDEFRGLTPGSSLSSIPVLDADADRGSAAAVDSAERIRVPTAYAVAEDMLALCKYRLDNLQANGINPEATWLLLAEGQKRFEEATQALQRDDAPEVEAHAQASWSYLAKVYPEVLATANDVVYGLVVMLLLAIPFAVICERLFIAGSTIGRKVAGFSTFFGVVFLFFFFLHPAFSLASTPVIIFLAFVTLLLSMMVIGLLYSRFEHEMMLIRMSGLGMHSADVNRFSTLLATGQLGISNMRRRPLRTFLTAVTVVLMTFILLTFANFTGSADTRSIGLGTPPAYNGILIAKSGWAEMSDTTVDRLRKGWGDELDIFPRYWFAASDVRKRINITGPQGTTYLEGVVGIRPGDPSSIETSLIRPAAATTTQPEGRRGLDPEDDRWLFLPDLILEQSGLALGQEIIFQGLPVRIGRVDPDRVTTVTHLSGDPFTPLSEASMTEEQKEEMRQLRQASSSSEGGGESMSLTHLGPETVAYTLLRLVEDLGGSIRSLAMVPYSEAGAARMRAMTGREVQPGNEVNLDAVATDMAHQLAVTLTVGDKGDTRLLTSVTGLSVSGLSEVLIPLILGGLIIFSTMLGSVAERGKEIFIFSSLGLAPIHIGALFLVEASIYAVLGGLGGYILAQFLVASLGWFATLGIGVQPDLNYSSFTAVATILLVMATVLLSALYPAWVASRSAKPGDDKDFSVPEPEDDRIHIDFPFTVARRDVQGLLAFLKTYFDANSEASVGCFTAANAQMQPIADGSGHEVTAKTWLAPFDLGISQRFRLLAQPTDLKAIFGISLELELLSGQRSAWRRVTLPFLKELRKQFLVWRTLDEATMDRYRAAGGDADAAERLVVHEAKQAAERRHQESRMASSHSVGDSPVDGQAENADTAATSDRSQATEPKR